MPHRCFQDHVDPDNTCFGCGPANDEGLHLRSHAEDEVLITPFRPKGHHTARSAVLNGGIQSTVLDCSGIWTAVLHDALKGDETVPEYVTAGMNVRFRRPGPIDTTYRTEGRPQRVDGKKVHSQVRLVDEATNEVVSEAEVIAYRWSDTWGPNPLA